MYAQKTHLNINTTKTRAKAGTKHLVTIETILCSLTNSNELLTLKYKCHATNNYKIAARLAPFGI